MSRPDAGHPTPDELEADPPSSQIAAHLESCPRCRVERRLLGSTPAVPEGLLDASRARIANLVDPGVPRAGAGGERYQIEERLGRGSSAEVHRAWDPVLRRRLALKVLAQRGERARVRFIAEAQITAQLQHPNIVPVHDLGVGPDGAPMMAMKEVHGLALDEACRSGRLATLEAHVDVVRRVCDAIDFAHHRGVVHRDLKPGNVMVGEFGEILVVDRGLARAGAEGDTAPPVWTDRLEANAESTREGQIAGTPAYMAPEQARGEISRIDRRTDVHALGGILFFVLVGRPPLVGTDTAQVIAAAGLDRVPRPREVDPRVPRELDVIVCRAMSQVTSKGARGSVLSGSMV